MRKTLRNNFSVKGTGIHTGVFSEVIALPSFGSNGIYFSYQNYKNGEQGFIPCHIANVVSTTRCTMLGNGQKTISTVEHLMATLFANGITDAELRIEGPEVPAMDGSGLQFQKEIDDAGVEEYEADDWDVLVVEEPMEYQCSMSGAHYQLHPADEYKLEAVLKYNNKMLGNMRASWTFGNNFAKNIAPSRTFSLYSEVSGLLKSGLIQGGNFSNALLILDDGIDKEEVKSELRKYISGSSNVSVKDQIINGPMFYDNEPARHKILDMLGDFSLLNLRIRGKITATRPGHTGNYNFARYLINNFYG